MQVSMRVRFGGNAAIFPSCSFFLMMAMTITRSACDLESGAFILYYCRCVCFHYVSATVWMYARMNVAVYSSALSILMSLFGIMTKRAAT